MITLNDQLTGAAFKTLDSSSVLLGKNGWLFYKSTLEDYTGAKLLQLVRAMLPLVCWG